MYDFLKGDVTRLYPDLHEHVKIILVEATGHILGSFHSSLVSYVEKLMNKRRVKLLTSTSVTKVDGHVVHLNDGSLIPFGLMVWSTGVKQLPLISELQGVSKFNNGRLKVDSHLRVLRTDESQQADVIKTNNSDKSDGNKKKNEALLFALGDCAGNTIKPLPALAQVIHYIYLHMAADFIIENYFNMIFLFMNVRILFI